MNPTAVISAVVLFRTSPIQQMSLLPKHTAIAKARKQANAGARKLRSASPNNLLGDVVGTQSHILALARCRDPGSNRGPSDPRSDALSTELRRQMQKVAGISRQHRRLPCTLWRVSIALPDQGMGREQPCEHTGTIPGARHLPQFLTEHHDISTPPLQVASTLPGRLELPTLRLTASRSNQLS